jgi:hypothetical protein
MAHILINDEGKRVEINMEKDLCLFDAPHNPPNTGTAFTRGTDLYAHKARSGSWYYYHYVWSMWQGENSYCHLVTRAEAIEFLQQKATLDGCGSLDKEDIRKAVEHFGEDIFSENA